MPRSDSLNEHHAPMPLDDRAFAFGPRGFTFVAGVAALAGVGLTVWAAETGLVRAAVVATALVASAGAFYAMGAASAPRALAGGAQQGWGVETVGVVAFVGGVLVAWNIDRWIAGAMTCGLVVGLGAAMARTVRQARSNRGAVDTMASVTAGVRGIDEFNEGITPRRDAPLPSSKALEDRLRTLELGHRTKVVGWAVATAMVFGAAVLVGAGFGAVLVAPIGLGLVAIAGRTWLGRRRARRAFTHGTTVRKVFVTVVGDPNPKAFTSMCAIWDSLLGITEGVLDRPSELYRSDPEVTDLLSHISAPVIHQAWVGSRVSDGAPAWIIADHGLALPLHAWWGGGWSFRHHTRASRPEHRVQLTIPEPRHSLPSLTTQELMSPKAIVWGIVWRTLALSPFLLTGVLGL